MKLRANIQKTIFFTFLFIAGAFRTFAVESTAYVTKIIPYPDRPNALQIFLDENGDLQWEKRFDLFGESVQQVLKDNIKENGGIIYESENLKTNSFTSKRLLAIILPDGNTIEVLDLFPHFNDSTLNFTFPYAFAERERENNEALQK